MSTHQCNECPEKQKEIDRLRAECERLASALKEMEALNSANQALVAEYEQMLGDMDFGDGQEESENTETGGEDKENGIGTPETAKDTDRNENANDIIKQLKSEKTNLEIENEELLNKVRELEAAQESLTEERDSLLERLALIEDI